MWNVWIRLRTCDDDDFVFHATVEVTALAVRCANGTEGRICSRSVWVCSYSRYLRYVLEFAWGGGWMLELFTERGFFTARDA